ncbi:MAG: PEP-CTERM sorting domain-containing protein [Desulfobacula sp.]|nr:PEP-CTERM sorting domain-containing protein [Desulfobacula sp.]
MKFLRFLLLSTFLVLFTSAAHALPFGIALGGDGVLNTDSGGDGYVTEIDYSSYGIVDLSITSLVSNTASGTFKETALIKIGADEFGVFSPEMTIVMSGMGDFTADFIGGDIGDQDFKFTSGSISIYIDDYITSGTTSKWATIDATDGSLYGADDGDLVAVFDIANGNGSLQLTPGETDNVDIWSLSTDVLESGYFFFKDLGDFADVSDILNGIFVQMYTNDTNEVLTDLEIIANLEAEFAENGVMTDAGEDAIRVYIESEGSAEFNVVPEPGTMILFGIGLLGFARVSRRKFNA